MDQVINLFPDAPLFLAFLSGAFILALTPGADMAFVAATSVTKSWRAGWAAAAGIFFGCFVHISFAVFGLSALLMASETAFSVVKYAGAAYLLYLAYKALRNSQPASIERANGPTATGYWGAFRRGFLINILNPKVGLFFLAFLPQFTDPAKGSPALQIFILGVIFNCIGTGTNLMVAIGAEKSLKRLSAKPLAKKIGRWLTATLFSALALRLALAGRE